MICQLTLLECQEKFNRNIKHIIILWKLREERNWYYHGTQESRLERILVEGLKPNTLTKECNYPQYSKEAVYLTISKNSARCWAIWNRKKKFSPNIEKAFVIKIPRSRIGMERLISDSNLKDGQSFEFHGIIEPPFEIEEISNPAKYDF